MCFVIKIQDLDIELIFVDDGSKDQTRTILKKILIPQQ
ncbi:glycosyltransferase [Escherichia coli]